MLCITSFLLVVITEDKKLLAYIYMHKMIDLKYALLLNESKKKATCMETVVCKIVIFKIAFVGNWCHMHK